MCKSASALAPEERPELRRC